MRLLITRAEPGASASAARLRRLGHEVLIEPMLRIEFLPPPPEASDPAALVVTSANAVRAVSQWPAARRWRDLPVLAVGGATAAACREAGFTDIRSASGGADALYDLVRITFNPEAGVILCPVAETPAADLAGRLATAGFFVRTAIAYRAIPATRLSDAARTALANRALDSVLFYSQRGAAAFAGLIAAGDMTGALASVDFFALSAEVVRPLDALSPRSTKIAPRPDEDSLFAALTT